MSSSTIAEANAEKVSEYLLCTICKDLIRNPKVLPCLHSFCQQCLEDLAEKEQTFSCPQCLTKVEISRDEVKDLPNNYFLGNMLDIASLNSSETQAVPCTNCDLNSTAKFRCIDCGEFLCGDCFSVHKRIRQTKKHQILTLKELLSTGSGEIQHRVAYCKQHSTEQLKYYCDTCNEAVCRDCLIIEHRQHKYDYIKDSKKVKKQKSNIETLLHETEEKITIIEKTKSEVESVRDTLYGRRGTIKGEIRSMTTLLVTKLRRREQQLLVQTDQMFNQKLSILEQQIEEVDIENERFKTACEFTEQYLNFSNEVEMLALKEVIQNRLTELNRVDLEIQPRERGDMVYQIEAMQSENQVIEALGKVKSHGDVVIESRPKTSKKDITNPDHVSLTIDNKLEIITLALKDPDNNVVSPSLNDQNGVEFEPQKEGVYSLSIQCSDRIHPVMTSSIEKGPIKPVIQDIRAKQTFGSRGDKSEKLSDPQDVAVDVMGHVVISDSRNHRIQVYDPNGRLLRTFGRFGTDNGHFQSPNGVAINHDGHIVISDMMNNRMQIFTITGEHVKTFGQEKLYHPSGVIIDKTGRTIIVDRGNARVVVYDKNSEFITSFGNLGKGRGKFNCPSHVAVNDKGHIVVSDFGNDRIQVFSSAGRFLFQFGESGRDAGQFNWPTGVAINAKNQILISDSCNHRIQIFNPDGSYDSQFGVEGVQKGEFKRPAGISIDNSGNILIADWGNDRVQSF